MSDMFYVDRVNDVEIKIRIFGRGAAYQCRVLLGFPSCPHESALCRGVFFFLAPRKHIVILKGRYPFLRCEHLANPPGH